MVFVCPKMKMPRRSLRERQYPIVKDIELYIFYSGIDLLAPRLVDDFV